MSQQAIFVTGASSRIAMSLISLLLRHRDNYKIIAVSRSDRPELFTDENHIEWISTDYTDESLRCIVGQLEPFKKTIAQVFIFNGMLHNEQHMPEKRLEDYQADKSLELFAVNTLLPLSWIQALLPILRHSDYCQLTVLSARVGSIDDNELGGWYSYRASKAALNMCLKNASIEYKRRAPKIKIIAYHPGTTDTQLSKPFQRNVPVNKLFSPEVSAQHLLSTLGSLERNNDIEFIDWQGESIDW